MSSPPSPSASTQEPDKSPTPRAATGTSQHDEKEPLSADKFKKVAEDQDSADSSDLESGEASPVHETEDSAPPLPSEPLPDGPPLPEEPVPAEDDGWDCLWEPQTQAWYFYNRFTQKTQWENPRVSDAAAPTDGRPALSNTQGSEPPVSERPVAGGYNPAIHGDYDPNAWYAQGDKEADTQYNATTALVEDPSALYAATATFNRFNGQFQTGDTGPGRYSDEAKSNRQMNAFFDVDAAANAHNGRSLKAERSNKKPSKSELKAFKEKRRARKEEKRRAWLRD